MSDFMDWVIATLILIFASMGIFLFGLMLWWAVAPESEERKARRIAEETPRIYAQVDGCTVYTWLANGRNHYFTKCPTKVTTESRYSEYCGKACSKERSETIETER